MTGTISTRILAVVMGAISVTTLIAGAPRVASADPEPLRPAVTRRGWQLDLTGYVQADSVAWSQASVDELDPSTGEPLDEERFLIRRGRLRAEAREPRRRDHQRVGPGR